MSQCSITTPAWSSTATRTCSPRLRSRSTSRTVRWA
ncbi:hypothetical protein [Mycobacterium sp. 852002-10029_SCH5224772]